MLGRWISRDPLAEDGGPNLTNFVSNSPTNDVDSLGEKPKKGRKPQPGKPPTRPRKPRPTQPPFNTAHAASVAAAVDTAYPAGAAGAAPRPPDVIIIVPDPCAGLTGWRWLVCVLYFYS